MSSWCPLNPCRWNRSQVFQGDEPTIQSPPTCMSVSSPRIHQRRGHFFVHIRCISSSTASSLPLSGSNEFPDDQLSSLTSFVQDLSKFPPISAMLADIKREHNCRIAFSIENCLQTRKSNENNLELHVYCISSKKGGCTKPAELTSLTSFVQGLSKNKGGCHSKASVL